MSPPCVVDRVRAGSFDNNLPSTNFILHPLAGALMYDFSRVNGLPVYASFAYAAASSLLFEFFLEYREKASINDLIFTPFGGMALGEVFFQLGGYVNSAPGGGGWGNQLAAYTLGLPQKIHNHLDRRSLPLTGLPADSLGFSEAYGHRFALGYGFGVLENDRSDTAAVHSFEIRSRLAAMPGFLRSGRFNLGFDQGNFSDGRMRVLLGADGLEEIDWRASALLAGYFAQDFSRQQGFAQAIGVGTGFRYYDSWRLGRRDGYAFVHPLEPVLMFWVRAGELFAHGRAEASVDFAGIRPAAYEEWSEQFGTEGLKSVLTRQGYVFAGCVSGRLELEGAYRALGVGGDFGLAYCRSIQGLDRDQDLVTRDLPSGDLIVELKGWIAGRLFRSFELRAEIEDKIRQGSMDPLNVDEWDLRAAGVASYLF
jgi:hypothetical protein